jgi:hypothetical protein
VGEPARAVRDAVDSAVEDRVGSSAISAKVASLGRRHSVCYRPIVIDLN